MHCNQCNRDYPPGVKTCPVHNQSLVSAGESPTLAVRPHGRTPPPQPRIHGNAALAPDHSLSIAAEPEEPIGDSEEDKELAAGTMCGEYRVVEKIGQGGMGSVYAGLHPLIGKKVAIKVLNWRMSDDSSIMQRFVLEARAVNQIGHHNIVDIFAYGTLADGRPYLVMEYLQGQTLKARLRTQPLMTYGEVFDDLGAVCGALAAAHDEKIIHRDLKPDNIFLAVSKSQRAVKLLDFGIAKLLHRDENAAYTRTGASIGTPTYMSPEQCLNRAVDARTDIYALGVIMYVIFTGNRPFGGASAFEILDGHVKRHPPKPSQFADLPPSLEALILKCLEKSPDARPQSVREVQRELDSVKATMGAEVNRPLDWRGVAELTPSMGGTAPATGPDATLEPRSFTHQTLVPTVRSRGWVLAAGVTAIVLVGAGLYGLVGRQPEVVTPTVVDPSHDLTLQVFTEPTGAFVTIDGKEQKMKAPFAYHIRAKDSVALEVKLPSGKKLTRSIAVEANEAEKSVTMQFPGGVIATADVDDVLWSVTQDGKTTRNLGTARSVNVEDLMPGKYVLRGVFKSETREEPVEIMSDKIEKREFVFAPVKPVTVRHTGPDRKPLKPPKDPKKHKCGPNDIGADCE